VKRKEEEEERNRKEKQLLEQAFPDMSKFDFTQPFKEVRTWGHFFRLNLEKTVSSVLREFSKTQ